MLLVWPSQTLSPLSLPRTHCFDFNFFVLNTSFVGGFLPTLISAIGKGLFRGENGMAHFLSL
jgi:hypothetical protein